MSLVPDKGRLLILIRQVSPIAGLDRCVLRLPDEFQPIRNSLVAPPRKVINTSYFSFHF